MKITVLEPSGFCSGVERAIKILDDALENHKDKQIYVYGEIIHNLFVLQKYKGKGVIFLEKNLEATTKMQKDSVLIIPAHGATVEIINYAKENGIMTYEATCPFIGENIRLIKEALSEARKVFYIGDKNHDESKAILSISNNIYLLDKEILKNYYFTTDKKPLIICQSTLENNILNDEIDAILKEFPDVINKARVCSTTQIRQNAIANNIDSDVDLIYIVGDKNSNNTQKLLAIAKKSHPHIPSYIIGSFLEIQAHVVKNKNHIAIASGASTPKYLIDAVVSCLNHLTTIGVIS